MDIAPFRQDEIVTNRFLLLLFSAKEKLISIPELNSGENVVLDALMLLGFFRVIPTVSRSHK